MPLWCDLVYRPCLCFPPYPEPRAEEVAGLTLRAPISLTRIDGLATPVLCPKDDLALDCWRPHEDANLKLSNDFRGPLITLSSLLVRPVTESLRASCAPSG